jgi:hypothetical protein
MNLLQSTTPNLFEIIKFIMEIVIIGGFGVAWTVLNDLRNDIRKGQELLLSQRKAEQEDLHRRWERLYSELKPAMEIEAKIAVKIANDYYLPVVDAIRRVEVYAEVYETIEQSIMAGNYLINFGKIPDDIREGVRNYLLEHNDTKSFIKANEEAHPNAAGCLARQLEVLYSAIEKLINSGYIFELEESIGLSNLKHILNLKYASDLKNIKNLSPEKLSHFLKSWRSSELKPLQNLCQQLPWEKFLSRYYWKLHNALELKMPD